MSKVLALYHIVFCTKYRKNTIPEAYQEDLYRFFWSEITAHKSKLIRIGGIGNHIHLLIDLHPTVCLANLIASVKAKSSGWMRTDARFTMFDGWAKEYYASSIGPDAKPGIIEYIKKQKEHHRKYSPDDEFRNMYHFAGLTYNDHEVNE